MRVTLRGWGRDHGEKEIMQAPLESIAVAPENLHRFSPGETYLKVEPRRMMLGKYEAPGSGTVHVWASTKVSLNGSYLAHLEIDRSEIARLFHLAFGHRELDDIVRLITEYREEGKRRAAAVTVPKEEARKAIVAQWLLRPAAERGPSQMYEFVREALDRYSWPENRDPQREAWDWISPYVEKPAGQTAAAAE